MDLAVGAGDTLGQFRALLHERTGIQPRHQLLRLGYPPRALCAGGDEHLSDVGIRDGEVVILENLRDLFLGDLESGAYTMCELLCRLPPSDDGMPGSTGAEFRSLLAAFGVGLEERCFWDVVRVRLRSVLRGEVADQVPLERFCAALILLRRFFQHHNPQERLSMIISCLPVPSRGLWSPEISVDRMSFLRSSAAQILNMSQAQLLSRVVVRYEGERGIDGGGLTRDFFSSFATRLGDDEAELWQLTGRGSLQPTPELVSKSASCPSWFGWTSLNSDDLYRACGRVFGMAVLHGCKLGRPLSRSFVRLLVGDAPRGLGELQAELCRELRPGERDLRGGSEILERPLADTGLSRSLRFTRTISTHPEPQEVELVPGGAKMEVTDENKEAWLEALLRHELVTSVEKAARAFRGGLIDVFGGSADSCPLLCLLDADDLIELWGKGGVTRQEVAYWRAVTRSSPALQVQVDWFWEVLEDDFNDELRGKVLQFTTGSSSIGHRGMRGFLIEPADGGDERLPLAQTCGNMLLLPRYSQRSVLAARLRTAAEMCCSFAMM